MSTFAVRWEALPPAQRQLWPAFSGSAGLGFVLYGETAVALRLGHRTSLDFDFFTERPLDRNAMAESFAFLSRSTVVQDRKDTLSVLTPTNAGEVKVSFFGEISIGRVGVPDATPDGVLEVASLLDLLATKLKVLQQRIEAKDYLDVIAMLKSGVGLEDGLAGASAMYGLNFQPSESLKALSYFEGGDLNLLSAEQKELLSVAAAKVHRVPIGAIVARGLSSRG